MMFYTVFVLGVTLSLLNSASTADTIDFEKNCRVTYILKKKCAEPIFEYPNCVPWFLDNCQFHSYGKFKKMCKSVSCEVRFYFALKINVIHQIWAAKKYLH